MSSHSEDSQSNIQVTHEIRDGYVLVALAGTYPGRQKGIEFIETLFRLAKEAQFTRVLVDIRKLSGNIQGMDRYEMGDKAGMVWDKSFKVAIVYRPEAINRFFEDVAINRGVNTRVFFTEEEATGWLISDEIE